MILINNHEIKPTTFPDGTSQIWKLPDEIWEYVNECRATKSHVSIRWDYDGDQELIQVCQLAQLIKREHCIGLLLNVPFLPYGRQDKEVSNNLTFGLTTFAEIIGQFFDAISTIDAHSNKLYRLNQLYPNRYPVFIDRFPNRQIERAYNQTNSDLICYPDKGAKNRYSPKLDYPFIYMNKVRDQLSGEITGLEFGKSGPGETFYDITNRKVLIVDDICDGGRTFIETAKKLYENRAEKVSLYVTHGIFSKGIVLLEDAGIQEIYDKDGLCTTYPF